MTTAERLLQECADAARRAGQPGLADALDTARLRLGQPMRVAVAGQIKRGKSTLVNALLGEDIAPTAQLEATFTLSEFHDLPERRVLVRYTDPHRPPRPVQLTEFRRFTVRDPAQAAILRGVHRVEYGLPNRLLRTFRLVDTPGLGSVHGQDERNTAAFLGIDDFEPGQRENLIDTMSRLGRSAQDVHRDSADAIDQADAVVYLFDRAVNERDMAAVADFLGPLSPGISALKAFGVLSRCDETYWPPGPDQAGDPDPLTWNPLAVADRIVQGYLRRPECRRMFYTVLPVAGLVGVAAQTFGDTEFGWLDELTRVDRRRLAVQLEDAGYFGSATELSGVRLPTAERAELIRRLGAWGTLIATGYLQDGLSQDKVRERLLEVSGVQRLRSTIGDHFGNRAAVIKLDHGLNAVTARIHDQRLADQLAGRATPEVLDLVADRIQQMRTRHHGFAELTILGEHYRKPLEFTADEVAEMLRVTGEDGVAVAARLGQPADSSAAELERVAAERVEAWARRLQDPFLDRRTHTAARVLLRSLERLAERARAARVLLQTDADPDWGR